MRIYALVDPLFLVAKAGQVEPTYGALLQIGIKVWAEEPVLLRIAAAKQQPGVTGLVVFGMTVAGLKKAHVGVMSLPALINTTGLVSSSGDSALGAKITRDFDILDFPSINGLEGNSLRYRCLIAIH
ncbi:hypothetical protein [Ferrimonas pelagia]|uniref:hypothetical protein n=1 Tax=Ferrimonas pelagia TaxID=1177826 RepID=UPI0031E912D7